MDSADFLFVGSNKVLFNESNGFSWILCVNRNAGADFKATQILEPWHNAQIPTLVRGNIKVEGKFVAVAQIKDLN